MWSGTNFQFETIIQVGGQQFIVRMLLLEG